MTKIIQAINVMVSNPELITEVTKGVYETECFFKYDSKHVWSTYKNSRGNYVLSYYPNNSDLDHLASIPEDSWAQSNILSIDYSSGELATKEAKDSMAELFTVVSEKVYGMDNILDEIIMSDDSF